jgi:hypothetical protein
VSGPSRPCETLYLIALPADNRFAVPEPETSEYRVEKARARAELTLTTGATVRGCFFLWTSSPSHGGPERIGDLMNREPGFFPFQLENGHTALYNRAHIVLVRLPSGTREAHLEPGSEVATRRAVSMLLSTGTRVTGTVFVHRPAGRDRLSDYARSDQSFRYVEIGDDTLIVNSVHLVELREVEDGDV